MADETSIVARQVRLRQWAEQIRDCQNRPEGMDVSTWCALHNITKANYYYRLKRVRKACLDQIPKAAHPAFVELPEPKRKAAIPADISDQDIPASDGSTKLMDFLDEQRMCRLYEKFILEYYRREFKNQITANASRIPWQLDNDENSMLPLMQSTMSIVCRYSLTSIHFTRLTFIRFLLM